MKLKFSSSSLSVPLIFWLIAAFNGSDSVAEAKPIELRSFLQKPKLVLVLVVDQFRADYLTRFQSRFLPAQGSNGRVGGFRYLMERGAYFPFAQFEALQNMTCPGHAMILTGALPYRMQISTNLWFDQRRQSEVYCVEDPAFPVVASGKTKYTGLAPTHLLGSTVGDELKSAGYPSRVVTVSLKDRSAIMLGGHRADLALWFDENLFEWTSSRYYLKDGKLPEWIGALNSEIRKRKDETSTWSGGSKSTGLTLSLTPDFKRAYASHHKEALAYPIGVEFTVRAAQGALREFGLGKGRGPDILAVSFSSHDYLGHKYGAVSREMEEMTVTEDRWVSELLNSVKSSVPGGLESVTVVLTADHGVAHSPSNLAAAGVDAGTIDPVELIERVQPHLSEKFGSPSGELKNEKWIIYVGDLNFYLNRKLLEQKKVSLESAESELKVLLLGAKGVASVFTRSEYLKRDLPPGLLGSQILKSYVPDRNGDVVIIPKPNYFQSGDNVSHMTGYAYDRTVPLIFAGRAFRPGVYGQSAVITDIASTLAFTLGVIPPSLSEGRVLAEALR